MSSPYGPQGGWGPPPGGAPPGAPPGGGGGWGPPPAGPPGWGPPPGGGWGPPQGPPGGWGHQPFGAPPGGGPHMHYRPPQPSGGGGCGFIALGGIMGFSLFMAWLFLSYQGFGVSALVSLFLAGCVWLLVFGVAKQMKKKLPTAAHIGVLAGVAILFTVLGPSVGSSVMKSRESSLYDKLTKNESFSGLWISEYEQQIPEAYRRKDWRLQWMKARVREGKQGKNAGELRTVANECADASDKELLDEAREDAVKALTEMYEDGKKRMNSPSSGSAEFPVDNALREAFSIVLTDLARARDSNVYVSFQNTANLDPPKDFDKLIKEIQREPQVLADFPKGNAPVIDPGSAFSPAFDNKRRATFLSAMTESFGQVFDGQLLTLVPLEKGADKKGKLILEVSSNLKRENDVFLYTSSDTGVKKLVGFLMSFEVEWNFQLIDRNGKVLYKASPAISKPSDAKFDTGPGDPDWAPYSVMMDSAYYNYSREVTGRFGLVPPPKKAYFVYSGADSQPPPKVTPPSP